MKWIRWGGLIAFLLITGLIVGFWILLIDGIVERVIEDQGTSLVGAKVELEGADLSLMPTGLVLSGLQVTNPDEPMSNAVEITQLALTLDGLNLLRRKVIVNQMAVTEVRFGTPRKTSGAVTQPAEEKAPTREPAKVEQGFSLPSFDVPDVKEILAKEDLETLKLVETLQRDIQQEHEQWDQRLKDLPGKDTFDKYQQRIEKLKGATKGGVEGILGGVGEVQAIQKDIRTDIAALQAAQTEFKGKIASLRARLDQAVKAPQADVRRLQEKYSLSPQGLANLGATLLGQQVGGWAQQAVAWYGKLKPLLERVKQAEGRGTGPEVVKPIRGSGVDVRFPETQPLPDLLIRLADVSLQLDAGDLSGRIENITPDQDVLGKPLTFDFAGEKLQGLKSVSLKGNLNHIQPANPNDRVNLHAVGYQLHDVALSKQEAWPVSLTKGLADIKVRAGLEGEYLTASVKGNLSSLQVAAGRPDDANPLTQSLSSALSGVSRFGFNADITGTLEEYKIALQSDLDRVMKQAAGKMVQDLSARFTKQLNASISEKVRGPLKELQGSFGGLNGIGGDLASRLTQGNDLLRSLLKEGVAPKGLPGGLKLPF